MSAIDPVALERELRARGAGLELSYHPTTPSTQEVARRLIGTHGAHAWLIVTGQQSAGHGRAGRHWVSSPDDLTFSLTLPIELPPARWGKLGLLAGLAGAQAIRESLRIEAGVKWPNDLFVGEAKVGGCLGELFQTPTGPVAAWGIGVNIAPASARTIETPPYPTAGLREFNPEAAAQPLLLAILDHLLAHREWAGVAHDAQFLSWWQALSLTRGQRVRVLQAHRAELVGESVGLTPEGALLIRDASGTVHTILAGDVSLRPDRQSANEVGAREP